MFPAIERLRRTRAFTLVEVIVTMTISGFVVIGVIPFYLQSNRSLFTSEQKLLINADIRTFTTAMIEHARAANYFILYQAYNTRTRADGVTVRRDANQNGTVNASDRRVAGQSGEFIVFAYYEDPFFDSRFFDGNPNNNDISAVRITRLVAYWAAPNRSDSTKTALYLLDTDTFKPSAAAATWATSWGISFPATLTTTVTFESLLPPATTAAAVSPNAGLVINDLAGLGPAASLFVNYLDRSIVVRAKILHGNRAKRVTNTYNFTVTPRG